MSLGIKYTSYCRLNIITLLSADSGGPIYDIYDRKTGRKLDTVVLPPNDNVFPVSIYKVSRYRESKESPESIGLIVQSNGVTQEIVTQCEPIPDIPRARAIKDNPFNMEKIDPVEWREWLDKQNKPPGWILNDEGMIREEVINAFLNQRSVGNDVLNRYTTGREPCCPPTPGAHKSGMWFYKSGMSNYLTPFNGEPQNGMVFWRFVEDMAGEEPPWLWHDPQRLQRDNIERLLNDLGRDPGERPDNPDEQIDWGQEMMNMLNDINKDREGQGKPPIEIPRAQQP